MKRKIVFRGKRIDNGEWCYGSLLITTYNQFIIPLYDEFKQAQEIHSVVKDTVGQYTGLKDKNGVEIYEGDKIKSDYYSGTPGIFKRIIGVIVYCSCKFQCDGIDKYEGLRVELHGNTTVIGNIHQTPTAQ